MNRAGGRAAGLRVDLAAWLRADLAAWLCGLRRLCGRPVCAGCGAASIERAAWLCGPVSHEPAAWLCGLRLLSRQHDLDCSRAELHRNCKKSVI